MAPELEKRKRWLPLQPGSKETGMKMNGRFAQRGGHDIPEFFDAMAPRIGNWKIFEEYRKGEHENDGQESEK